MLSARTYCFAACVLVATACRPERLAPAPELIAPDAGTSSCGEPPSCQVPIGLCSFAPAPDGAACALPCGAAGSCLRGQCLGTPATCDDSDLCTVDSCSETFGCVHLAASCPAPDDPCLAAACDPASGCTVNAAPDGTTCGPSDCDSSSICLSGSCVTRATPEGTTCGAWSPCQPRGVCRDHLCDRPAAVPLRPLWSSPPSTGVLDFPGLVDSDGNLYWRESSTLVSVDRDGVQRYAVPVDLVPLSTQYAGDSSRGLLLVGSQLLLIENSSLFTSTQARLEALDKNTGALSWTHDFAPELKVLHPCPGGGWEGVLVGSVASDGASGLYAIVGHWCGNGVWTGNDLLFVDLRSGETVWTQPLNFLAAAVLADEDGNAYFLTAYDEITSVDRNGALRARLRAPLGSTFGPSTQPSAVFGGHFISGTYEVVSLDGGGAWASDAGFASSVPALDGMTPLIGPGFLGFFVGDPLAARYVAYDPSSGTLLWVHHFSGDTIGFVAQPVLTQSGSTLAITHSGGQSMLTEITSSGGTGFSCVFPRLADFKSVALRHGRLTVQTIDGTAPVQSFDLPGYEPAEHGWVTAGGKMTREGHPR